MRLTDVGTGTAGTEPLRPGRALALPSRAAGHLRGVKPLGRSQGRGSVRWQMRPGAGSSSWATRSSHLVASLSPILGPGGRSVGGTRYLGGGPEEPSCLKHHGLGAKTLIRKSGPGVTCPQCIEGSSKAAVVGWGSLVPR